MVFIVFYVSMILAILDGSAMSQAQAKGSSNANILFDRNVA
jgi:hypothetical protein